MDKNSIIRYMKEPEMLGQTEIEEMEGFLQQFPYCQTARMIYTKSLNNENHISFDEQLKKTAAYCIDRKVLYELIINGAAEEKEEIKKTEKAGAKKEKKVPEKLSSENQRPEEEEDELYNTLDKQILSAAISNTILLESEKNPKEEDATTPSEKIRDEIDSGKKEAAGAKFNENKKHALTDWVSFFDNPDEVIEKSQKEKLPQTSKGQALKKGDDKKSKFFSASEMAKNSIKEDADLYTETLAKIYAQQENFGKAIEAYQKLSLKYPEKRSYFANQINLLKDKLKEK